MLLQIMLDLSRRFSWLAKRTETSALERLASDSAFVSNGVFEKVRLPWKHLFRDHIVEPFDRDPEDP